MEPVVDPVSGVVVTVGDDIGQPSPLRPPSHARSTTLAPPRTPRVLPPGVAHARRSAILMLVGLGASTAPLPWTAVAVVPLVWAGVESVSAIRAIRAIRARRTMSSGGAPTRGIVSGVVGLVLVCVLTVVVLLPYAVYGPAKRLQDCTAGANTAVAVAACKSQFSGGLESLLGGFLSAG
jgi:hypothetical protein